MNVGIAYRAFVGSFKNFYPELKIINPEESLGNYDLIIFPGGEDINPRLYREENTFSSFNDERDVVEVEIFNKWTRMRNKRPKLLGVCRGHQLIHALLGGVLIQDIGRELKSYHGGEHSLNLNVKTEANSLFETGVNSMHHQGVKFSGKDLVCTAHWKSVPEVTESDNILTVQFHPEFMGHKGFFEWVKEKVENNKPFYKVVENIADCPHVKCRSCSAVVPEYLAVVRMEDGRTFCSQCAVGLPGRMVPYRLHEEEMNRQKEKQKEAVFKGKTKVIKLNSTPEKEPSETITETTTATEYTSAFTSTTESLNKFKRALEEFGVKDVNKYMDEKEENSEDEPEEDAPEEYSEDEPDPEGNW